MATQILPLGIPCYLGVDPGLNGGVAFYYPTTGALYADDIPTSGDSTKRIVEGALFADMIDAHAVSLAAVELVGAMPGNGGASMFRFGQATGTLIGVINGRRIPLYRPTPQKWTAHFNLPKGGNPNERKEAARQLALRLFPASAERFKRVMDHGRAEAALIALYTHETQGMRTAA